MSHLAYNESWSFVIRLVKQKKEIILILDWKDDSGGVDSGKVLHIQQQQTERQPRVDSSSVVFISPS